MVAIDINSGLLNVLAPEIASITTIYFYINSVILWFIKPIQKQIQLKIINCEVDALYKCSSPSLLILSNQIPECNLFY